MCVFHLLVMGDWMTQSSLSRMEQIGRVETLVDGKREACSCLTSVFLTLLLLHPLIVVLAPVQSGESHGLLSARLQKAQELIHSHSFHQKRFLITGKTFISATPRAFLTSKPKY